MKLRNVRRRQWERYALYLIRVSPDGLAPPGLDRHYNRQARRYNRAQARKDAGSRQCRRVHGNLPKADV